MTTHTIVQPGLTQTQIDADIALESDPLLLTVGWKQFSTMKCGDGLVIEVPGEGTWLGEIQDMGDPEFGQNWIWVDWT